MQLCTVALKKSFYYCYCTREDIFISNCSHIKMMMWDEHKVYLFFWWSIIRQNLQSTTALLLSTGCIWYNYIYQSKLFQFIKSFLYISLISLRLAHLVNCCSMYSHLLRRPQVQVLAWDPLLRVSLSVTLFPVISEAVSSTRPKKNYSCCAVMGQVQANLANLGNSEQQTGRQDSWQQSSFWTTWGLNSQLQEPKTVIYHSELIGK